MNKMNIDEFKNKTATQLKNYILNYSSYTHGDFGNLERVEIEGHNKVATIDIWSKGWLAIDIYDLSTEEQIMNIFLGPTEIKEQEISIEKLIIELSLQLKD